MAAPKIVTIVCEDLGFTFSTTVMDEISISKGANWGTTDILNRSSPVINYSSSGSQEVSFTVNLFATEEGKLKEQVTDPVNTFLSTQYPISPGILPPPACRLTIPGLLYGWRCVFGNVSVSAKGPWTIDGEPMVADVSLSFTEVDTGNTSSNKYVNDTRSSLAVSTTPWGGIR